MSHGRWVVQLKLEPKLLNRITDQHILACTIDQHIGAIQPLQAVIVCAADQKFIIIRVDQIKAVKAFNQSHRAGNDFLEFGLVGIGQHMGDLMDLIGLRNVIAVRIRTRDCHTRTGPLIAELSQPVRVLNGAQMG